MINEILRTRGIANINTYVNENTDLLIDPLLSSGDFKNSNAEYYFYYPYMFSEAFVNINLGALEKLNLASYFCFRYVVLKDSIIDNQVENKSITKYEKIALCYMQHALKLLKNLFDEKSLFWKKWKIRKYELDSTVELDKTINSSNYTEEIFKEFAWNKSGLAKLAIDALFILDGEKNKKNYDILLESHKEFSCAMQIYDDLFDVVEDQKNIQFNFAFHKINNELKRLGIDKNSLSKEEIEKYFFASGKAKEVLSSGMQYIKNAMQYSIALNVDTWENVLKFYQIIFTITGRSIDTYIKKIYAEEFNSNIPLLLEFPNLSKQTLDNSIEVGLKFINERRNKNGSWDEYLTAAGSSDVWATGFVLFFTKGYINKITQTNAKKFLIENAKPYWGYRESFVNDLDSSNFALLVIGSDSKFTHLIDYIYKWQNTDGGIPTYPSNNIDKLKKTMKADENENYIGWTQSHPCVSSVSYYLLNTVKHDKNIKKVLEFEEYFMSYFKSGEKITYWWTNEIYSLYFLVLSLNKIHNNESLLSEIIM